MTRYFVTLGERSFEVEVGPDGVRVDDRPVSAELQELSGGGLRCLSVEGRSHRVLAERAGRGEWSLHVGGSSFAAEVLDERGRHIRELAAATVGAKGPRPVVAPMPGMVMAVEVAPGDEVAAGQGIVIIEAMKMENELKAEAPGRVSAVRVEPGQAVEKGTVLVEFE